MCTSRVCKGQLVHNMVKHVRIHTLRVCIAAPFIFYLKGENEFGVLGGKSAMEPSHQDEVIGS